MGDHGHDVHFLLIVLIMAFFVVVLSTNQLNPGITGNAVRADSGDFIVNLLKESASSSRFNALSSNVFEPIHLQDRETAEAGSHVTFSDCRWINADNEHYDLLKYLSGAAACKKANYASCVMTSKESANSYYSSKDGSCKSLQLTTMSSKPGSCDDLLVSSGSSCFYDSSGDAEPQAGDSIKSSFVSVFCCR